MSRLVLQNGYARGRSRREGAAGAPEHDPFIALLNSGGWGDPNNGFMRARATMVLPETSPAETTKLIELIANANSTANALAQRHVIDNFDVTADLAGVRCPALIIHARRRAIHPVGEGRRLAAGIVGIAGIAGAEFIEVKSGNTFFVASAPARRQVTGARLAFLDDAVAQAQAAGGPGGTSRGGMSMQGLTRGGITRAFSGTGPGLAARIRRRTCGLQFSARGRSAAISARICSARGTR